MHAVEMLGWGYKLNYKSTTVKNSRNIKGSLLRNLQFKEKPNDCYSN